MSETLDAPIVGVTVYLDRARVTRRVRLALPAGEHRLLLGPLPLGLHHDSVRVGGRGPATVLGVDVVTHRHARTPDATVAELQERRRALAAELAELEDADTVQASRADFVDRLAQRAGGTYARALAGGQADVAGVSGFADALVEQLTAVKARQRELRRRREALHERLAAVDRQLHDAGPSGEPDRLAAAVTLSAGCGGAGSLDASRPRPSTSAADAQVELELSYVVGGAGWQPSYDARLDDAPDGSEGAGSLDASRPRPGTSAPRMTLTWFGLVTQHTGEDWPECELLLSTARPAGAVSVPELDPWYLDRLRPRPAPPPVMRPGGMARSYAMPAPAPAAPELAAAFDQAVTESVAAVEQGVAAATYRPARPVAVPADGAAHRATVAVLELPVTLDHVTAPVRSPEAHLRATVVNGSAHTLLPGAAAVFHGGDFVGSAALPTWAPGEEVELALGIDDRIRVERELVRRTASKAALTATRRRDVEYRTTVANHTPRPARVTVLDQLPVSRDEGIVVRETAVEPAPAERTDLGVLTWRLELAPGESRQVVMGLRVELARGVEMTGWRE